MPFKDLYDKASNALTEGVQRLAAKGSTITYTGPRGKSAGIDMPKLAQEQADRTLGKVKSATAPPSTKVPQASGKSPLSTTMTPHKKAGQ